MESNIEVEQAVRNWLAALLSASEVTIGEDDEATDVLAFTIPSSELQATLHTNVGTDIMPEGNPWLIVGCRDLDNNVGPLWTAVITFAVSTPSMLEEITEANHQAVIKAVMGCLVPANKTALSDSFAATAGCTGAWGGVLGRPESSNGRDRWQWELDVKMGLKDTGS